MKKNKEMVVKEQLSLFMPSKEIIKSENILEELIELLQSDLNFHNQPNNKNFHSFPAKFPPELPRFFISHLTEPGETVLDPMVGSGTTIVEAYLLGRKAIGFDIDPLALKISRAKTTFLKKTILRKYGTQIYFKAKENIIQNRNGLKDQLANYFDSKTKQFIDYWFFPETQLELLSLINEIKNIPEIEYRNYFEIIFSSLIITKSGGVSLALDLGHTRPHRVKTLLSSDGKVVWGEKKYDVAKKRFSTKILKSAIDEFRKKFNQSIISKLPPSSYQIPDIHHCDSQNLFLQDESVDLIVTSPPYASNAIDYMRAHKFSLVWFGHKIDELTKKRNEYIGSEATVHYVFEELPKFTKEKIREVESVDSQRGKVLKRYYSEMKKTLTEMFRVLKSGKVAIIVIGNSIMKGVDTQTPQCLQEIGRSIGFIVPTIGVRQLDRNRRMLPASKEKNTQSQIQNRMHEEYVIGFYKP